MIGAVIIVVVIVIVLPVLMLVTGGVLAAVLGSAAHTSVEADHAGSELVDLS